MRYIPTLVGRLFAQRFRLYQSPVHPHACGEISYHIHPCQIAYGTSPRLWGDWNNNVICTLWVRYIPTLVGRLPSLSISRRRAAVHPHACGEICYPDRPSPLNNGTSPRLWGDFLITKTTLGRTRYIPTLVGRFVPGSGSPPRYAVHPHACGEIEIRPNYHPTDYGTSPRLWGDSVSAGNAINTTRYIPTLVGRFTSPIGGIIITAVHPHACGEILRIKRSIRKEIGTSPRLWGDYSSVSGRQRLPRYIPRLWGDSSY